MNQFAYLVVLSHTMDEIPLRLFTDQGEAFDFARTCEWEVPETLGKVLELPDCSTPCVVSVWAFRDGEPVSRVIVRDFEDEEPWHESNEQVSE